jgi:hypothetical protein
LIASRSPAYHGFLRNFNGHRGWKRGKAPENRPPRYRGSGALLPGLSRRQVPILTGIDRNGRHIDAMLGRRSKDHVIDSLVDVVEPESVLCTDAFSAYEKLAERIGAEHRIFEPPKDDWLKKAIGHAPRRKGALDLWRVNAHHETMKTLVNRRLHGVSTKYLPNYLVVLRLERRPPPSPRQLLQAVIGAI